MADAVRYKCQKCNFGWKAKSGELPRRCPYCGSPDHFDTASADAKFIDVDDLLK